MSDKPQVTVPIAIGWTATLAALCAALWWSDWRWIPVGVAALLAAAAWSAARERTR